MLCALASIDNTGLASGQYFNFTFTTTPENFITGIDESSDAATVYPGTLTQSATYNNLNQLTDLSGQALTYDLNGNLTSDGQRNYTWDAENRLIGISYPNEPGKQTTFSYDGLGRRTAISSTPAGGGSAVTTSYIWCGARICQARDSGNSITRGYFAEGELVPGAPAQPYYYGADQIGSVRRAFASTISAPAYSYDPYGNALQGTAPVTDFGYAGMFYNADSGLYLTQYRVYDPIVGRWLSRDPLGAVGGDDAFSFGAPQTGTSSVSNENSLYTYVQNNPVSNDDPLGLYAVGPSGSDSSGSAGACGESQPTKTAQAFPPFLFEEPPVMVRPPIPEFPQDVTRPPAPGWEWRGAPGSSPGSPKGNWYNPETGESLHPDPSHPPPIGPHMDYRAPNGQWYRWYPDGRLEMRG